MAFRTRKVFGTFEKRTQGSSTYGLDFQCVDENLCEMLAVIMEYELNKL